MGSTAIVVGSSSGTYNVRATEIARERRNKSVNATVHFLDDTHHVFDVDKGAKGQVLLDQVFQHLELIERDYFGLQYAELAPAPDAMRWLDATKTIKKQLKIQPYNLYFRVKFYVSDPSVLQEEYTRYHFFLQLKKDILEKRLIVPSNTAALLASYSVQSELGDYAPEDCKPGYISELRLVPNQTSEMERKVMELHKLHVGQTPADAEYNFLDHVKRLDMYGVDLHPARDNTKTEIQVGVTSIGLVVFQNHIKINTFSWAKIVKISFKRKQFFIQLRKEGHEAYDAVLGFNLSSYRSCKTLWKSCVEHHSFFRLHTPKTPSKRYLHLRVSSLLSLGSKFRYSGKSEFETVQDGKRQAKVQRSFVRSPSRRYASPHSMPILPSSDPDSTKKSSTLGKGPAPIAKMNGNGFHTAPRHYDGFFNKVSAGDKEPKKAWAETDLSDDEGGFVSDVSGPSSHRPASISAAFPGAVPSSRPPSLASPRPFTPAIQAKFEYADEGDDDRQEIILIESVDQLPSYDAEVVINGNDLNRSLVSIRIKPNEQGRFGFNVKGGADQNLPIVVSRVAPNTPADRSFPRLNEGDEILSICDRDVAGMSHEHVVGLIRTARDSQGDLLLSVRPNMFSVIEGEIEEPPFRYVPDVPAGGSGVLQRVDALAESMLLLKEGLESGALVAQFEQQYRKKPGMTMNVCRLPENVIKNRYRDIAPYDLTRVVLQAASSGDYVNANHVNMEIPTLNITNRYIAAQGPLPNTCGDYWHMVWEQGTTLIVMLTMLSERNRVKCHQYWPHLYESADYDTPIRVTCHREQETPSFAFREFTLTNTETNEKREVSHMQYLAWPDHGVPDDSWDFLQFVIRVRHKRVGMNPPTVVHCSAGIGRTGVLILMETAMCLISANEPVYPLDIVRIMRDQRAMLIQTASQYRFVCEAVLKVYNERIVKPLPEYRR